MDASSQLKARVEGHVQGVGFRQFVYSTALTLKLRGWVRNTFDGDVEVVAEGSPAVLEEFLDALRKGPRMAYVTQVHYEYGPASGEFADFRVTSTA